MEAAITDIFNGTSNEINEDLFNLYNDNYSAAVGAVYGKQGDGDAQAFKINLGRLAAAKTSKLTAELDRARADKDGVVLPLDLYKIKAKKIIQTYNRHQVAEYNTFVARCRSAKQFEKFNQTAHIFPNLKWIMTRSASPREEHLSFVDLVLPIGHPFWENNQPGNLYGCKCDWTQTDEPVSTNIPDVVKASVGLEGNPFLTKEIVSDKHPYFKNIASHIPKDGELMLPDSVAFIKRTTSLGKTYLEHSLAAKEAEAKGNRKIVEILLDNDNDNIRLKLLPLIHAKQTALRDRYYGVEYTKKHPTTCPDSSIDDILVEFKGTTLRNMGKRANEAARQSDIILINVKESLTEDFITRFTSGLFAKPETKNVKKIIIITQGRVYIHIKE